MLQERRVECDVTIATTKPNNKIIEDDDNANSAKATAISCRSEQDLQVACFCEENVWRLAYRRLFGPALTTSAEIASSSSSNSMSTNFSTVDKENEQYYVVFVSNDEKCCPMLHQRASRHADEPCLWDYHVILIQCTKNAMMAGDAQVLDMDSRLPYPCTLDEYLDETFTKVKFVDVNASKKYAPKFRVIRAELYLTHFYSDRMHMFKNGKWSSPPPTYDCIVTNLEGMNLNKEGKMSNLDDFISMEASGSNGMKESSQMGQVLTLMEIRDKFGQQ
jgi:hypothetical protein